MLRHMPTSTQLPTNETIPFFSSKAPDQARQFAGSEVPDKKREEVQEGRHVRDVS